MSEDMVTITMKREYASALYNCLIVELGNEFVARNYLVLIQGAMDALHEAMGYGVDDE